MTKKFISQNDDVAPELTSDPIFVVVEDTPKKPNQAMQIHRDKNLKHLLRLFPWTTAEKIEAYYNKKYNEWQEIDTRATEEGSNYYAYTETIVAIDNALWKREEGCLVMNTLDDILKKKPEDLTLEEMEEYERLSRKCVDDVVKKHLEANGVK